MPESIRALIVLLGIGAIVYSVAKNPASQLAGTTVTFERRRNLWFAVTLVAFLSNSFWICMGVVAALVLVAVPKEPNKLALYFALLFAIPAISAPIAGLGSINHFFEVNHIRLLALTILLPSYIALRTAPGTERFGSNKPDKFILGYMLLQFLLVFQVSSFTNSLRHGVFYGFVDVFLPYYVASRSVRSLQGFRDALMAFLIAGVLLGTIAVFEFPKHWLLYGALNDTLDAKWGFGSYQVRGENLRALASTGHPIALGYVLAVALGFLVYLRNHISRPLNRLLFYCLIIALIATLSRGPWLGAAAIILLSMAFDPASGRRIMRAVLLGIVTIPILLVSPFGDTIVSYLPFVGSVESETVEFRQQLVNVSIQVIMQNPYFGAFDYVYSPAMQELKQGGIIDVVNSYLGVALSNGLVGLTLFLGIFVAAAWGIARAMKSVTTKSSDEYILGQSLLVTLAGILIIIGTVSGITVVPAIYWSVAGLGVAYSAMIRSGELKGAVAPRVSGYRSAARYYS